MLGDYSSMGITSLRLERAFALLRILLVLHSKRYDLGFVLFTAVFFK